jgi:hypothetical protein
MVSVDSFTQEAIPTFVLVNSLTQEATSTIMLAD